MAEQFVDLEIISWAKYNPRNDIKEPSWFRVNILFFSDPEFLDFNSDEKMAWLYILSLCCRKQSGLVRLDVSASSYYSRISAKFFNSAIEKLVKLQIIRIASHVRNVDVTDACYIQTNKQTNTQEFDFEKLYTNYPRKDGKKKGLQIAKKNIKDIDQFKQLEKAITNYRVKIESEKIEPKYVKHFDTFMNCWTDYLEYQLKPNSVNYSHLIKKYDV